MARIYKKGAGIAMETLAKVLLLVGFFLVAALIISAATGLFTIKNAERTVCYVSNALTSSNFVFKALVPNSCSIELLDEAVDEKQLTELLKDTWHMFGKGDFDLGNFGHETFTPFAFKPKSNILVPQYYSYLQTHKNGNPVADRKKSDYEYLQKGSLGQTLCFAKNMIQEGKPLQLEEGQRYYINFFDDQRPHDCGDKILISKESGFTDQGILSIDDPNYFFCYSPDTQRVLLVGATPDLAGGSLFSLLSPELGLGYVLTQEETTFCKIEHLDGES